MKKLLLASAISVGAMASSASAVTLTVEIWDVIAGEGLGDNPDQPTGVYTIDDNGDGDYFDGDAQSVDGAIASRPADVKVGIDSADFAAGFGPSGSDVGTPSAPGPETIASFFNLVAGDVISGDASVIDNFLLGTVIRVTGFIDVVLGSGVDITSDDGWQLNIGGTLVDEVSVLQAPTLDSVPFPAAVVGPNQAFEFIWFEGNIVNAQLQLDLVGGARFVPPPAVPLPASALLLLGGLGGLGLMRRRKTS